jgi:tRNA G26 N,N-dimethylase Trm1
MSPEADGSDAYSASGVRGLAYAVDVADVLQPDSWLSDGSEAQLAAESLVVSRLVAEDAGQNVV